MAAAIFALKHSLLTGSPAWQIVSANVLVGAAVYGLCLFSISADLRHMAGELLANRPSWSVTKR
jgi:hypothetical protein